MKKFALVLIVLGVVAAVAYLLGTEDGRARRDALVSRARKATNDADAEIDLREAAEDATQTVTDAVAGTTEQLAGAVGADAT